MFNRLIVMALASLLTACATMKNIELIDDEHPSGAYKQVREAAEKSWIYAQLSNNVYGDTETEFVVPYVSKIEPEFNRKSGLKAQTYALKMPNSQPILVISYAGTEPGFTDWIFGNINPFNTQYKQGLQYLNEIKSKYPDFRQVVVTGHSLGGAISIYAASRKKNIQAYIFNPSVRVHGGKYGTPENIHSISQYAEILSLLRKALPNPAGTYTTLGCFKENPIERHSMRYLAECLTHISAWELRSAEDSLRVNKLGEKKRINRETNTLEL